MVSNAWLKDPPFYGCEKRRKIHLSLDVKKKKKTESKEATFLMNSDLYW
jgi:hypothetical protein